MKRHCAATVVAWAAMCGAPAVGAVAVYDQGFETDLEGIVDYPGPVARVASGGGTLGAASAGGSYHAELTLGSDYGQGFYTYNGGKSSVWCGYMAQSIDVYIDPSAGAVGDGWFWDAAICNESGNWGRGGGFGVQKTADDTWSLGSEDDYGGFDYVGYTSWATHTNTTPLTITSAGWFTLRTQWLPSGDGLRVDQINTVYDAGGTELWTDTLPRCMSLTPGEDDTAGGMNYSWLGAQGPRYEGEVSPRTGQPIVHNSMTTLAIDNVYAEIPEPATLALLALGAAAGLARRRRKV